MDKLNQWWTEAKGLLSKVDNYKLIAYGILVAILYSIAKIMFSFETLLKDYFLLDSKTVEYIFSGLLIVLIIIDKYQDYRIAQKKKE
jgi:predicted AlkP superfamily phosphohydrolase/phosphomutase